MLKLAAAATAAGPAVPTRTGQLHRTARAPARAGQLHAPARLEAVDALVQALPARLRGLAEVDAVLRPQGVAAQLQDQVARHRAEGLEYRARRHLDDPRGDLLAHLLEDAFHRDPGGLRARDAAQRGQPEGDRRGRDGSRDLGCEDAELGDRRDLRALDQHGDRVQRGRRHAARFGEVGQVLALDEVPVPLQRLDREALVATDQIGDRPVRVGGAVVDVVGELPHGLGHVPVVVLVDVGPVDAYQVQGRIQLARQDYTHRDPRSKVSRGNVTLIDSMKQVELVSHDLI
ncbi:hypothetical protein [Streptomyces sp. SAI-041]|uniref:hypothetical protein n=1 Tax=Streptomyces sp. SAI-041 TaxID=2940548 RepID=UPI002476EE12|nr:hypothetical protein [Streptomyces sp. SAI-041]MDH6548298.1 hypothetical protein [Streptomyces sp. SAI-041]